MTAKKATNSATKDSEFWKNPWAKLTGAVISITTILGVGYGAGTYKERLDWKIEKMELKQDCAEKVQSAVNSCREIELSEYKKSVQDIQTLIKEFQGKNEK
jgi:hypothetical protein